MTPLQRLQLRQSETRQSLNVLLALDELNDEQRGELGTLTTSMQNLEVETRAAIVAEGDPTVAGTDDDSAAREMRGLLSGASVGAIFEAAMEHRNTDGRTAELQQALRLHPNQIPLALLRMEDRATGVTPAPSNVGTNQSEIIPAVFPESCAAFLSVDLPTVGVGEAVFPVLSTSADVGTPAENAAQAETAGGFTADVLSPSRLQASFFYSREDRARFSGMSESLRMNLSDALADALDKQILTGTNGLLTGTNLANHTVSAVTNYGNYRTWFAYERVEGKFAATVADIRSVMGSATYGHASKSFRSDNAGDRAALEDLMTVTGGVKVSAHVPAASGNKQNSVVRLGSRRDMVAPIWEGVTLIPDEITKAANGQIVVTAIMLHAVKLLRSGGFYKQETQHA